MNAGNQWYTPSWAAQALWEQRFNDATERDRVLEPTCGDGRMLQAIPTHIPAVGVEIDGVAAREAIRRSGRRVITGNILDVPLPPGITIIFGNPPFQSKFMTAMMDRFSSAYADGCRAGLIVPAYFMQTPSTVTRWNETWTIGVELLPRTLFPRAQLPLVFAMFTKDPVPTLNGMRLYVEASAISKLPIVYRNMLASGSGLWKQVVAHALEELGGKAHLNDIYAKVGGRRPSPNPYWRAKVRQTLQRGPFIGHGSGWWERRESAAAA